MITLESVGKGLRIAGEWRGAKDGTELQVIDPGKETPLAKVADAGVEDGSSAVEAALAAGPKWAAMPPRERGEVLRRTFEAMVREQESIARLIVLENGKSLAEAKAEVVYAAEFLRWFAEEAVRVRGEVYTAPAGTSRIVVMRQPIGVTLAITPWNFPAAMATRKVGPALAAGCSVILKPAGETPLTALAMAQLFEEAGLPPGVLNVLPASRERSVAIVTALLKDPRVRKLSFTGSTETGRLLLSQAAQNIVKCSMELGGNAPFIVFADADIDNAVSSAIVAKLRNGGQSCTAANRFYAERPIAEEFAKRLAGAMREMKVGYGLDDGVQIGPLINEATRGKVSSLVHDAVQQGARALCGAEAPAHKGYFYQPTVLTGVQDDMPIMRREIFGPVAPIVTFDSEDQVVSMANRTDMGLVSFIQTRDIGRGLRVAERIESGMVGLNRGLVSEPAAPFGGWKQSGVGREGSHEGILEYLETKYVATNW